MIKGIKNYWQNNLDPFAKWMFGGTIVLLVAVAAFGVFKEVKPHPIRDAVAKILPNTHHGLHVQQIQKTAAYPAIGRSVDDISDHLQLYVLQYQPKNYPRELLPLLDYKLPREERLYVLNKNKDLLAKWCSSTAHEHQENLQVQTLLANIREESWAIPQMPDTVYQATYTTDDKYQSFYFFVQNGAAVKLNSLP